MEYWNTGMMEQWAQAKTKSFLSLIFFHYSNVTAFSK